MILTDETEQGPSNKSHLARSEQQAEEGEPDAGASDNGRSSSTPENTAPPPPYSPPTETDPLVRKLHERSIRGARRRFFRALLMACFVLTLAWASIVSVVLVFTLRDRAGRERGPDTSVPEHELPEELGECIPASKWSGIIAPFPGDSLHYTNLVYNIPSDGNGLIINSPPRLASGLVEIMSPENYVGPSIQFYIRAGHRNVTMLEHLYSCKAELEDGRYMHTLHIAFNNTDKSTEDIFFDIGVKLPNKSFYGNMSHFPSLETNMPHFRHIIRKMTSDQYTHFGSVALTTTNSPVIVENLNADKVYIMANRGTVDAQINATSRVQIHAPDGKISANLNLTNHPGIGNTSVTLTTSHGTLSSNFWLHSSTVIEGDFSILTRNAHAGTSVAVRTAPVNSTLHLDAFASQGSVHAALPPAFEGVFMARASRPSVHVTRGISDPAKEGRKREVVTAKNSAGEIGGRVWWVPMKRDSYGKAMLSAPGGQAVLDI